MPVYSFGLESPLKFDNLSPEYVEALNRSITSLMMSKLDHERNNGHIWDPDRCDLDELPLEDRLMLDGFEETWAKGVKTYGEPDQALLAIYLVRND